MPEDWPGSRADQNPDLPMPPVHEVAKQYMDAFNKLGRVDVTGMSAAPIRYTEITACRPNFTKRERDLIREMSVHYLRGKKIGSDAFGIAPWQGPEDD